MNRLRTVSQVPAGEGVGEEPLSLRWSSTQARLLRERDAGFGPAPLVVALELDGAIDAERLDRAWQEVQRRQPFLRLRQDADGNPYASEEVRPLHRANLPGSSPNFKTDAAQILAMAARPRDLTAEGPAEAVLIRTGPEAWLMICSVDHLATDGWSFGLIAREWSAFYRTPAPAPVVDPARVIERFDDPERVEAHSRFARNLLDELEGAQAFPLGRSEGGWAIQQIDLPRDVAAGLRVRAARERTTPFALALATLGRALSIDHQTNDIIVSTHVANRSVPQSEQVVCAIYNSVPMRIAAEDCNDLDAWVASAKQATLRGLQRQSLPFAAAREALPKSLPPDALLRVMINFDQHPFLGFTLPDIEIHEAATWNQKRLGTGLHAPFHSTSTHAWPAEITVSFRETWDSLQLYIHYGSELGDRGAMMLLGRVTEGLALLTDTN